jgi:photosystem II stability/assembly factor-like uncharacterized protein
MKNLKLTLVGLITIFFLQNGKTQWTNLGTGIVQSPRSIWSIAVPNENTVWAFAIDANNFLNPVFEFTKTTNGGETWQTGIYDIDPTLLVGSAFALDSLTLWLCTTDLKNPVSGKLYKTSDGGITWTYQNTAYNGFNEVPTSVHFFDEDTGVTFGAQFADDYDNQISIYTTTNGGSSWNKVLPPDLPTQLSGEGMTDRLGNGIYSVVGNTIWFPTTKGRVFKSKDNGSTWEVFETGLQGLPPQDPISIAMQDSMVGILVSDNPNEAVKTINGGETWEFIDLPTSTTQAFQVKYIPGTPGTYLIHDGFDDQSTKAFLTKDAGTTWEIIETNVSLFCSEFLSPTVGYGGGAIINSETGGMYKWDGYGLVDLQCPVDISFATQSQIDSFPILYPNCVDIVGEVKIIGSLSGDIINLEGLSQINTIGENLYITRNAFLTNLEGLNNLDSIGGSLVLYDNDSLTSLNGLNNLVTINGSLYIGRGLPAGGSIGNPILTNLIGLENLTYIGENLIIYGNTSLMNLEGLEKLTYIGEGLNIYSNVALSSLEGLKNVTSIYEFVLIQYNDTLTTCEVKSVCDYLSIPSNVAYISENATGCNNEEEVEDACESVVSINTIIEDEIRIYPNPTTGIVTATGIDGGQVEVMNSLGNVLMKKEITFSGIDISELSDGMYFIRIQSGNQRIIKRIIKL